MDIKSYRALFLVVILGFALLALSPLIGEMLPKKDSELFSEIWILGPDHNASGYPSVIKDGETNSVFIGGRNNLGKTGYYMVYVKLLNSTFLIRDENISINDSLGPLYEFKFFVGDGDVWEFPVTFKFEDLTITRNILSVGNIYVNGINFPNKAYAVFNSEKDGFFFDLSFELWRYNVQDNRFEYDGRFVSLRLKL
ncbi:MAG: DUF1616 domain-containing protein [Candidatus Bathyarchaeota archaeon]